MFFVGSLLMNFSDVSVINFKYNLLRLGMEEIVNHLNVILRIT